MGEWVLGLVCPALATGAYLLVAVLMFTGPRARSRHWED